MNKGILTVGIILLALIALNLLNVLNNYSTGSELDYYLLKETTDAAMVDALDPFYKSTCGLYRIDKEKFVESFLYRFATNVDASRAYTIGFYDINEVPPKVSVKIDSGTSIGFNTGTGGSGDKLAANISTSYDAVLETNYKSDVQTEMGLLLNSSECQNLRALYGEA